MVKDQSDLFRKPFSLYRTCNGRMIRYDLIPIPTGIRIIGSSEHDDLGRFANLSPCAQLGGKPNSYWENITEWQIGEIQPVLSAMAQQTRCQTADWIDSLIQHFPPSKHTTMFNFIFYELAMLPQAYTLNHLLRWEELGCFRERRPVHIELLANKGKRATPILETAIKELVPKLTESLFDVTFTRTTAYVLMHYAATKQTPGKTFSLLWRPLSSNGLKKVAKQLGYLLVYHPIARRCAKQLITLADQQFDPMPRDVREKWANERLAVERELKQK